MSFVVAQRPMIERYTHPEMGRIWSDQHRYETWLRVETAAADAMVAPGDYTKARRVSIN